MRKSAVIQARAIGFIEAADLLSGTKQSISDVVLRLAEHYSFEKFPRTLEDRENGLEFFEGASKLGPIKKLSIFQTGLVLDTAIDTSAAQAMIEEILEWGATELKLNYHPGLLKKIGYVSNVTFFSDAPILDPHIALINLEKSMTTAVSGIWQETVRYEGMSVQVGHDPLTRKYGIAPFKIERRLETPFSEKKYFSEAPLPTDMHWSFLDQYEKDVLSGTKGGNA